MQAPEPLAPAGSESFLDAQRRVGRRLAAAGVEDAAREARRLLAAATGLSAAALLASPERRLSEGESRRLEAITVRRASREPLSRILGEREFYGRTFRITPATLDPRPESETLIEAVLEIVARENWQQRPLRILDMGTGTGCLIVTLLAELPMATGVGTDIASDTLAVADENALRHGVAGRVQFRLSSGLEGIGERFDLLISNPPYIPSGDIAGLDPEVRDHDPRGALDGGPDGLYLYSGIAKDMTRIVPYGWVVVEVGAGQADDVAATLAGASGTQHRPEIQVWPDLSGHTRCVAARTLR